MSFSSSFCDSSTFWTNEQPEATIVVVTRQPRLWKRLRGLFVSEHYALHQIDAQELFLRLNELQPDLLLYDTHNPDPPPLKTCGLLKGKAPWSDIDLVALCMPEQVPSFYQAGCDLCIPFHIAAKTLQTMVQTRLTMRFQEQEMRRLHEALYQQRQVGQSQRKHHAVFVGKLSHEIRTPLGIIEGFTVNLLDGLLGEVPPQQLESLEVIHRNIKRLNQYLSSILEHSHFESQELQATIGEKDSAAQRRVNQRRYLQLQPLLAEVLSLFRENFEQKQLDLRINIPSDLPRLWMSVSKIRQVFINLLSNAYKYTPRGGVVSVHTHTLSDAQHKKKANSVEGRRQAYIEVRITDNGPGIPSSELPHIFDQFTRGEGTKHSAEGTGLGLSICKEIVQEHGGDISLQSQEGEGTQVSVVLPIDLRRRRKGKLLMCHSHELLTALLSQAQHDIEEIQHLHSKRDVQEVLESGELDLLLMDTPAIRDVLQRIQQKRLQELNTVINQPSHKP